MGLSASMGGIRAESRSSPAALEADATLDSGAKGAGSALSWLGVEATVDPDGELVLLVPDEVDPVLAVVLPAEADPDPPDPDPLLVELDVVVVVVLSGFGVGVGVGSEIVLVPPDFGVAAGVGVGVGVGDAVAVGDGVGDGQFLWHFPASAVEVPARMNATEVAPIRPTMAAVRRPSRGRNLARLDTFAVIARTTLAVAAGLKTWS
jgi:hypothetical protein